MAELSHVKLSSDEFYWTIQVMAWCRQASVGPDLCCHMALLGHNELITE